MKHRSILDQLRDEQSWEQADLGVMYRYQDYSNDVGFGATESVECLEFRIRRRTPDGVWLAGGFGSSDLMWIRLGAKRSFAYPTRQSALASFIARKTKQVEHLTRQLDAVREALRLAALIDPRPS